MHIFLEGKSNGKNQLALVPATSLLPSLLPQAPTAAGGGDAPSTSHRRASRGRPSSPPPDDDLLEQQQQVAAGGGGGMRPSLASKRARGAAPPEEEDQPPLQRSRSGGALGAGGGGVGGGAGPSSGRGRKAAEAAAAAARHDDFGEVITDAGMMEAVVKVFCVHTEPNYSLPWQRKRQYSSSSSGFIISGRRILTNAHCVDHGTHVKVKRRGSEVKFVARVLAVGTECDIALLTVDVSDAPGGALCAGRPGMLQRRLGAG